MTYCTLEEARAAGAAGNDAQVTAAIAMAEDRVDGYTQDRFSPRLATVVARVGGDGRALLPWRLRDDQAVTEVRDPSTDAVLAPGTFRVYSSAVPGQVDAIGLGRAHVGTNMLVVGLEPWADGRWSTEQVQVTATFGHATTPVTVKMATAILAARASRVLTPDDNDPATPPVQAADDVDPEGNVIPVVPPFANNADDVPSAELQRTTGSRDVDAMLAPYRRLRTLTGV